ncbi:MAG TPA: SGNH/GDSL hydrolase family protein [Actinophytocola sp.]|nr:SGNH/GDSL hydrolase family protein [Actinophytocola sp.]
MGQVYQRAEGYLKAALVPHTVYLLALVALFIVCRQGQQWPVVIVALVVYVVAATLVVRRQYVTWMSESDPKTPPYVVLWTILGLGLACIGIGVVGGWFSESRILGWFLFPGVIAAYLGAGALMTRARTEEDAATQWKLGLRATALSAGLTLGALVLFAYVSSPPGWLAGLALLGIGVGLAAVPVALSLLAERAIHHFHEQRGSSPRTVLAVILGGAGFALAAAIGIGVWKGAPGLVLALVVLAALVFAIVSGTLADIFAALGIIALMGVTPQQEPLPDVLQPGKGQRVLVAFGDSYMSGEGADTYFEGTDVGGENQCRRAPTAWAVQAAQRYFDGLVFLACSGARTYNVRPDEPGVSETPEPRRQNGEPGTQLDQYVALEDDREFVPGLVVISVGGNDAGFSTIGKACAVPGSCDTEDMRDWFTDELPQVQRELTSTFVQVRGALPEGTPVVATAYPDPIYMEPGETEPCDELALSAGDVRFIKDFLDQLNRAVHSAAREAGLEFIPQTEQAMAAAGVQLCDPTGGARPGVNFVGLRSVSGLADQRFNPMNWIHNSFHPNERGHAALLRAFDTWWAQTGSKLRGPFNVPEDMEGMKGVAIEPQCDLVGDGLAVPKCRSNADDWTVQQLAKAALPFVFLVLLVVIPVWLASAALFGWRRRQGSAA